MKTSTSFSSGWAMSATLCGETMSMHGLRAMCAQQFLLES